MDEKIVIFRRNNILYMTTEENYNSIIPNASLLTRLEGFDTYDEVVSYLWKWKKIPKNCIIDNTDKKDW